MPNPDLITWLTFAVSVILPAIVAFVTKQDAHPGVKAIVLLVLSAVTGFVGEWLDAAQHGVAYNFQGGAVAAIMSFSVAVLVHLGLLAPTGVTGSQGAIQRRVPGGIG
jgi:hypothetical protein